MLLWEGSDFLGIALSFSWLASDKHTRSSSPVAFRRLWINSRSSACGFSDGIYRITFMIGHGCRMINLARDLSERAESRNIPRTLGVVKKWASSNPW
jgi:hypothetical protein